MPFTIDHSRFTIHYPMKENLDEQIRICKEGKDGITVSRGAFASFYKERGWQEKGASDAIEQSEESVIGRAEKNLKKIAGDNPERQERADAVVKNLKKLKNKSRAKSKKQSALRTPHSALE